MIARATHFCVSLMGNGNEVDNGSRMSGNYVQFFINCAKIHYIQMGHDVSLVIS